MQNYSFLYHPIEKLHEIVPEILPSIEKIITIHYDEKERIIRGRLTEKKNKQYQSLDLKIDKILPTLLRYMEEKNPFDWYNKNILPFEIEKKGSNPSMNIFTELQNIVLLIRIPDNKPEFKNLIFLYLNENPSNFGVTNSINPLTTDNKNIIAFILNNTIRTLIRLQQRDRDILKSYNNHTRQIVSQAESLKLDMQRMKENYGISLVRLCQQIVKDHGTANGKSYSFSAGALEKIKNFTGDIKNLESIIQQTVAYADSLYLEDTNHIEILEWYIVFDSPSVDGKKPGIPAEQTSDALSKSHMLLEKLETAALVVKSNQQKLTGTNVGRAFPHSISAAAISDALYNHKSKINRLLTLYPDKWQTIRNEFRPLKNIISKNLS